MKSHNIAQFGGRLHGHFCNLQKNWFLLVDAVYECPGMCGVKNTKSEKRFKMV